jgi:hypothetical protein
MKKHLLATSAILSLITNICAFEDKPSLTRTEQAALYGTQAIGVGVGGTAGYLTGRALGKNLGPAVLYVRARRAAQKADRRTGLGRRAQQAATRALMVLEGEEYERRGSTIGKKAGIIAGTYAGFKAGKSAVIAALAHLHGVSPRIEEISQQYNINVTQYRQILTVAEQGNPDELLQAIEKVYPQRFGSNWKHQIKKLFKRYKGKASDFLLAHSFREKGKIKEFLRMVELGAAMANLFYKTNPNLKNTHSSAIKLYQELGLL